MLLATVRHLFGTPENGKEFVTLVRDRADEIAATMAVRTTQTNEPARCSTLLPVLTRLPQPLALLELGGPGTPLPVGHVEVVWRAGLDLHPIDLHDDAEVRWLKSLVWPGEEYRLPRLWAACEIARLVRREW